MNRNFYYEELPVRLIFRVGLTASEEEKLQKAYEENDFVEATYYTNKYDEDTAGTKVTFTPAESDPYYAGMTDDVVTDKSTNTTNTVGYSLTESYNPDTGVVTQLLGNNGSFYITKDNTLTIDVHKVWNVEAGTEHPEGVIVGLFAKGRKVNADNTEEEFVKAIQEVTLDAKSNWECNWSKLPRKKVENGVTYYYDNYYVAEAVPDGYAASYSDGSGEALIPERVTNKATAQSDETTDNEKVQAFSSSINLNDYLQSQTPQIDVQAVNAASGNVIITNTASYKLPQSGGIGDKVFTMGAMASVLVALLMIIINKRRKTVE
jgi:hypothetical protein